MYGAFLLNVLVSAGAGYAGMKILPFLGNMGVFFFLTLNPIMNLRIRKRFESWPNYRQILADQLRRTICNKTFLGLSGRITP